MSNVYDNWKIVTETDFVTLFIKTWFAYIATLKKCFQKIIIGKEIRNI